MKLKNYQIVFIFLIVSFFYYYSQSHANENSFYSTTWYLVNGNLSKIQPRSSSAIEVETWQGSISQDETWDKDYIITGDVTIEASCKLTIKPGVKIYFPKIDVDENGIGDTDFIVKGRLNCQRLPDKKIIFTSYQDNQQNKDWAGIDFRSQTGLLSTISNAEISYAHEAVDVESQNVTFNSCYIHHNL